MNAELKRASDAAASSLAHGKLSFARIPGQSLANHCTAIADQIVPEYRSGRYSCGGVYAKRWQAAYDAAMLVLCDNQEMN